MVNKIISELKQLYALPYFLSFNFAQGRLIILGDNNFNFNDINKIKNLEYHSKIIVNTFEKDTHTDQDKYRIAYSMKQILMEFDFKICSLDVLNTQTEQIKHLDYKILDELYHQIQMYKKALEYYQIYERVL